MAGGSFTIQVLIQVCLLKLVWEISQALGCQNVCSIEFFEIMSLYVATQSKGPDIMPIAGVCNPML